MNKLHSFAFYTLIAPAMTLGAGTALAEQSGQAGGDEQGTMRGQSESAPGTAQRDQNSQRTDQTDSQNMSNRQNTGEQSGDQNQGFLSSATAGGIRASDLMDTDIRTMDDEDLGEVSDLIIDDNGQILGVVVGVGGFLGMGEKDVAISWDSIQRTGTSDDQELRVDVTRDELDAAPEYEGQN